MKMSVEHRWNSNGREQPKYWESNVSHCQSVHHKYDMARPGSNSDVRGDKPTINMAYASISSYNIHQSEIFLKKF